MRQVLRSLSALLLVSALLPACSSGPRTILPGAREDGTILLPNGWQLSPAGIHLDVGELPLNIALSPDGAYALVTNNGTSLHSLSVVDLQHWQVVQTVPVPKAWLGIKFIDGGRRFLVSGGNDNCVRIYSFTGGIAQYEDSITVGLPWPKDKIWLAGLDADSAARTVYVAGKEDCRLHVVDLVTKKLRKSIQLSSNPYTVVVEPATHAVWVSIWGGRKVVRIDPSTLAITDSIEVGDHPSAMVISEDGSRLWVTNSNLNSVSSIDLPSRKVIETLNTALFPQAPPGSTPNDLALDAARNRLYVANADNNCLAVFDVSRPGRTRSLGFIPVGWYPTCVRVLPATGDLIVANGKGFVSRANPHGPDPTSRRRDEEYIGSMFKGTLSRIATPDHGALGLFTAQVYQNNRYSEQHNVPVAADEHNPVPLHHGVPSPIKHVFYIIKENRTYDQVFGDIAKGNGDPHLCLFPEEVTPNLHALANEFVLLDNFYADAEVSADGHNWSMGAYATDYTEKSWPTEYGGRGGEYVYEGGEDIVSPASGYLWDDCMRQGVTYRTYGEFVFAGALPGDSARPATPSLAGHFAPFYHPWDLGFSDVDRVREWMKEFDACEQSGILPQFQIIKLPNDHTEGTRSGALSPRAFVAQNDLAVGMVVERISHSRFWNESAIFVIEDDAQNGPDHVDAHRTEALVISPFVRRGAVDNEMYSTSSMVRTMELILGLPPMSQYDAAATPMYRSFTGTPNVTPYTARPARYDIHQINPPKSVGQARSDAMNFAVQDAAPDLELNEIIWQAIRGVHAEMPAPVRSAFVQERAEMQGEDD